jgi:diguanylate cyclase (GGDEF)-like protein
VNAEAFVARVKYLYAHRDEKSREEIQLKDGRTLDRYSASIAGENGKYYGRVWYLSDITERKQAVDKIEHLAFYDALTNLPNRRLLRDRLRHSIAASERHQNYGAVLFLDLDNFKIINDSKGHDVGDLLLIEVAKRLQACVRDGDTVARLGGDEFVVLIENIGDSADEVSKKIAHMADNVRNALALPYILDGRIHHSSPSIGVCLFKGNSLNVNALLKHAEVAMYQAKDAGRNTVRFYDPVMQQAVEARIALESDIRIAIAEKQFVLHYQVQVDDAHRPIGAEALIRWHHPLRGTISPAEFISVAEESSLILDIGQWVLETACRQLALWSKHPDTSELGLSINVSAKQFRQAEFVADTTALLNAHRIDSTRLKLELTETVMLDNVADIASKMHALKALGVKLSLDDFGTGYSSLSYLKRLPLDQLKIDQSFVRNITVEPRDAILVRTIIDMAKNFDLNVIAEGVETESQLAFLKQHGCMAYQGYLFSEPLPHDAFATMLKTTALQPDEASEALLRIPTPPKAIAAPEQLTRHPEDR